MKIAPGIIHYGNKALSKSLFNLGDPENWHKIMMQRIDSVEKIDYILNIIGDTLYLEDSSLKTEVGNMVFKNKVGIAAGFVKQPHGLKFLEKLGVGYITIGGVTKESQSGNNKQRIYKFGNDIVNGMGLPGDGWEKIVKMFEERTYLGMMPKVPIVANLCNSSITQEDKKTDEFLFLMEKLYKYVDGFEINVSCPNQCGVTNMQQEEKLKTLLTKVKEHNEKLAIQNDSERKTILVKIAPLTKYLENPELIKDLTLDGLEIIANVCNDVGIDGVTATNTSQEHEYNTKITTSSGGVIKGGLSGLGLKNQSLETVIQLRQKLNKAIPIIGCGGIGYDKGKSGVDMLNAGATSIEILSSLVQNSIVVPYYLKKAILESR